MKRLILAAAALAVPLVTTSAHALTLNYKGPISIHITAFDEGVLYQRTSATDAGVAPAGAVNGLTQSAPPVKGNPGEDTWGIFLVDSILANDGSNTVLYDRATASTLLTGLIWGGTDVAVQTGTNFVTVGSPPTVPPDFETVITSGSQIAVWEQNAAGFNAALLTAGPNARSNADPSKPFYAGVTEGSLIWSFNALPGTQFSTVRGSFTGADPNAYTVLGGNGGIEAVKGTTSWGTGSQNGIFQPLADGADIQATFGLPIAELQRGQSLGWTVGAKDPIDADIIAVPTPSAFASGVIVMAGMAFNTLRRRRTV